jgi:predicted permease
MTLKALISNPLIIACVAGISYSRIQIALPGFLVNTFRLASLVTLPLALISIGGTLTIKNLKGNFKLSLVACLFKLLLLPISGYLFMKVFAVTGGSFRVGMIFFTLPTSTAIYVLSSQLNSDTELASAAIMLSTVCSFISLSVGLVI